MILQIRDSAALVEFMTRLEQEVTVYIVLQGWCRNEIVGSFHIKCLTFYVATHADCWWSWMDGTESIKWTSSAEKVTLTQHSVNLQHSTLLILFINDKSRTGCWKYRIYTTVLHNIVISSLQLLSLRNVLQHVPRQQGHQLYYHCRIRTQRCRYPLPPTARDWHAYHYWQSLSARQWRTVPVSYCCGKLRTLICWANDADLCNSRD